MISQAYANVGRCLACAAAGRRSRWAVHARQCRGVDRREQHRARRRWT